jgi:hypothetical protein
MSFVFPRLLKAQGILTLSDIPSSYRFFFYGFDCHEPPNVHMRRERMVWQFWLTPVVFQNGPKQHAATNTD